MKLTRDALLGLLIDPARLEEILGDLEESRANRTTWARRRDVLSVCLNQSRLRTVPRELALPAVAAVSALLLFSWPMRTRTVAAHDDAGRFTVKFAGSEVVGATVDGERVPREQITRTGAEVVIAAGPVPLRLRIVGNASFVWESRPPRGGIK